MRIQLLLSFIIVYTVNVSYSQSFNNSWQFLGPDEKPLEDRPQGATGIGPVEHISAHPLKEGYLLASSINGGLFYSKNGGEQWFNSGSDAWMYSGCSWAEFHPKDENVWFANSCQFNANGGPGTIGHEGGIYRTMNSGLDWELVADAKSFINSSYLTIFGIKFHPNSENTLFVYTSEGVYYTTDCLIKSIEWKRVPNLGGWIYDLAFAGDNMYVTQMQHGKWNLYESKKADFSEVKKVGFISELIDDIASITIESQKDSLLILINYERKGDELWRLKPNNLVPELIINNQRVIFGKGNTFSLSPFNNDNVILGYSTNIKGYSIATKKTLPLGSGYHVDVEGVLFDPFDSLKIYLATHGGVYRSDDGGLKWVSKSRGIGIAEVEGLAVSKVNPNLMAIGCFHDGSMLRADFGGNGLYQWKNINGGDGLIPLMPKMDQNVVYTSNQYVGGGLYFSSDSGKTNKNLHNMNGVSTSGWRMTGTLHPIDQQTLFFNFVVPGGSGKGNIDIGRTLNPDSTRSLERISDFNLSHGIEAYTIYGVYVSEFYPNVLFAHMIEETKDEDGKRVDVHRIWKTENSLDSANKVIMSWYPLEIPRSDWIGSITMDKKSANKLFITYTSGKYGTELTEEDKGLIYSLKYKKSNHNLKKELPISRNLPYSQAGRYNFTYDAQDGVFFGTRTGVYYGSKRTQKGKEDWIKVGVGSPHCKVRGLFYNEIENSLTIGYYGRGVWKYYLP